MLVALAMLQSALAISAPTPAFGTALAVACTDLERGDYQSAERHLAALRKLAPTDPATQVVGELFRQRQAVPPSDWLAVALPVWGRAFGASFDLKQFIRERLPPPDLQRERRFPLVSGSDFVGRAVLNPLEPDVVASARLVLTRVGDWNSPAVRLVAARVVRESARASDARGSDHDHALAGQLLARLIADFPDDIGLRLQQFGERPFGVAELGALERDLSGRRAGRLRPILYHAARDALEHRGQPQARSLAYQRLHAIDPDLGVFDRFLARVVDEGTWASSDVQEVLSRILDLISKAYGESSNPDERWLALRHVNRAREAIGGGPAAPDAAAEARALEGVRLRVLAEGLLGLPLKPLRDELLDALGTDEMDVVRRLRAEPVWK